MHAGTCLCGAVRYEIRGDTGPGFYCHGWRCRKAGGSAFASNAVVAADDFVVVQGEDALKTLAACSGLQRVLCGYCGSPIMSHREGVPQVRLRLGTLYTPPGQGPQTHIYTDSKADWWEIRDELPRYPDAPPRLAPGR